MNDIRSRIINVEGKPRKCPVCGGRIWDIIYGTGDMTEIEFFLKYRKEASMGGDKIPRTPPIWACACGCKRFRKVNADGSDAPVKLKFLKEVKPAPATMTNWETSCAIERVKDHKIEKVHHYKVEVRTELDEREILSITAVDESDAEDQALALVMKGLIGLRGRICTFTEVKEKID